MSSDGYTLLAAILVYLIIPTFFITWIFETLYEDNNLVEEIHGNPTDYIPNNGWVRNQWQLITLGIIERVLYLTSIVVGKPEFIAVWLTLKTVYESWSKEKSSARRTYNTFLVGNGLSILYAFAAAGIIQGVTDSILPSLPTILQKNILLFSVATPIILSLVLKAFLCYARKELNNQKRTKLSTGTQTNTLVKY
jgi:hypothetical protein